MDAFTKNMSCTHDEMFVVVAFCTILWSPSYLLVGSSLFLSVGIFYTVHHPVIVKLYHKTRNLSQSDAQKQLPWLPASAVAAAVSAFTLHPCKVCDILYLLIIIDPQRNVM